MPSMNWRFKDWLGFYKKGIRHRRRPLSRNRAAELLEPRTLLAATAVVHGTAFIDANGNHAKNNGEIGVRGVVVHLSRTSAGDPVEVQTTTDKDGAFRFVRVPEGTYRLTGEPGDVFVGSTVTVNGLVVGSSGEVTQDLELAGLKPDQISLRQFLNTSTTETLPFEAAGDGSNAPGNNAPTVLPSASLDITMSQSSATSPPATNVDLSGIFTDQNLANSEVRFDTSEGDFSVELFDALAPQSVANFYEYVTSNRYDGTIFHRMAELNAGAAGLDILQGGGYASSTLAHLTTDPSIKNEFNAARLNLTGTLSMARSTALDSGTSEFFFNLNDNPGLDNVSGNNQYAVFGEVVGATDQTVLDQLALIPTFNVSPFSDWPLVNYSSGTPTTANHVKLNDVEIVRRDEFLSYTLMSGGAPTTTIDTTLMTATIVNHRLQVTPKTGKSGQVDIVVRAMDSAGVTVTATFRVHIVPPGNVAPVATVSLTPEQPHVNSTLTATATKTDVNSGNVVTLTYVWKNGSTVLKTTSGTTSLTDTLDLRTLDGTDNEVDVNDTITVEVTPNDGFVDGLKVSDFSKIV